MMRRPDDERLLELCRKLIEENDPDKVLALSLEIDRLVTKKVDYLRQIANLDPKTG